MNAWSAARIVGNMAGENEGLRAFLRSTATRMRSVQAGVVDLVDQFARIDLPRPSRVAIVKTLKAIVANARVAVDQLDRCLELLEEDEAEREHA